MAKALCDCDPVGKHIPAVKRNHAPPSLSAGHAWQWAMVLTVALAMASGGCGGCGSGGSRASEEELAQVRARLREKAAQEAKAAAENKKRANARKAQRVKKAAEKAAQGKAAKLASQRAARSTPSKPQMPTRPEDLSSWKEEDYFTARAEGDPRLLEAMKLLVQQPANQESTARLLSKLLKPDEPTGIRLVGRSKRARKLTREQVEMILGALAGNRTDIARQAIQQVASGKLPINGRNGMQAAIQALGRHPTEENEAILYRILVESPDRQTPAAGRTGVTGLDSMILAAVRPEAAEAFRVKLAQHLFDPGTNDSLRERLVALLSKPCVENLAAQLVVYQRLQAPPDTKTMLERYFAVYSSETLRRLLGIPEQARSGSLRSGSRGYRDSETTQAYQAATADPELPGRVSAQLWSRRFATRLTERLYHVDSLAKQAHLVLLAGTIPVDSLRSSVYATLSRNWQDGPEALRSVGLPESVVGDPGMIVVIKTLPHEALGADAGRRPPIRRASVHAEVEDARRRQEKTLDDWARFCGEMVLATCGRLELAARARVAAEQPASGTTGNASVTQLPLTLHDSARVVARYHAGWPENARTRLPGMELDSMRINYVRIEETARYRKLLGYYRRQAGTRRETANAKGVWLEALRDVPGTNRKLSLDVVIRKATTDDTYEKLDVDEKVTVDILAIEIRDPARESAKLGFASLRPGPIVASTSSDKTLPR